MPQLACRFMILLIDNYDSFTYNLAQFLGQLGEKLEVRRNDQITLDRNRRQKARAHRHLAGPRRTPERRHLHRRHSSNSPAKSLSSASASATRPSAMPSAASVVRAPALMHGKTSRIHHDDKTIFRKLPQDFVATRYHSLIVERKSLPRELEISAETDGLIMGLRHRKLPLEGVQFHPESVLTEVGMQMLRNFLSL